MIHSCDHEFCFRYLPVDLGPTLKNELQALVGSPISEGEDDWLSFGLGFWARQPRSGERPVWPKMDSIGICFVVLQEFGSERRKQNRKIVGAQQYLGRNSSCRPIETGHAHAR